MSCYWSSNRWSLWDTMNEYLHYWCLFYAKFSPISCKIRENIFVYLWIVFDFNYWRKLPRAKKNACVCCHYYWILLWDIFQVTFDFEFCDFYQLYWLKCYQIFNEYFSNFYLDIEQNRTKLQFIQPIVLKETSLAIMAMQHR